MRAPDERQAAVGYTYAWWLTGADDAALALLRAVLADAQAPESGEADPVALLAGIRARLRQARPMCPASELALLHDGLGLPLDAAAQLSSIPSDDSRVQLAHGRLEALLETVREEFTHPERLGGLAVANPPDVAHARQCPSCARASTLIERGRAELREVAALSPPPGLLERLAEARAPETVEETAAAPAVADRAAADTVVEAPGEPPVVKAPDSEDREPASAATGVSAPPAPPEAPPPPPPEAPPPPAPERVALSPARRRAAWILAGAGLVALFLIVPAIRMSAPEQTPTPAPGPVERPTVETTPTPTPQPTPTTSPGFGPPVEDTTEFSVVDAGILLSGQTAPAPSGTTISPQDPLRIAVDYRNAADGVTMTARWLVNGEPYRRMDAVVTGQASRHVWGVPLPPDGWPLGQHRVVIVGDDSVIGAIDFVVQASD